MKKTRIPLWIFLILMAACQPAVEQNKEIGMKEISAQLEELENQVQKIKASSPNDEWGNPRLVPRTLNEDGSLRVVAADDWTSGFYPGVLWYIYELTGEEAWMERAVKYTEILEDQQYNASNHDVGFRMFCSYGNAYRLSGNEAYVPILVQSAETLLSRWYGQVGSIRSWDFNQENWQCPVIIDNMMNLELLFWTSEQTGDPKYYDYAFRHALTTLENHFRSDNSSWHVIDYDTISGEVRNRNTHQGYADESAWARGQSWGLYGFTMTYRFTEHIDFLRKAEAIADFLLGHPNLPEDLVPFWDYNAPNIPDEPRDVSAAAIMASALYELSTYSEKGAYYREKADLILKNLGTTYASAPGENHGFILGHSVGAYPMDAEIDVPLNYADYYYLEGLLRKKALEQDGRLFP